MSKQQAFDDIVAHLRKQGVRSNNGPNTSCQYRSQDGLKCAIGGIFPDEIYSPSMEMNLIGSDRLFSVRNYLAEKYGNDISTDFWSQLQFIHDQYIPEKLEHMFESFAKNNNLTYAGIPKEFNVLPRS